MYANVQSYQELLQMLAEREQEVVTLNAKYAVRIFRL